MPRSPRSHAYKHRREVAYSHGDCGLHPLHQTDQQAPFTARPSIPLQRRSARRAVVRTPRGSPSGSAMPLGRDGPVMPTRPRRAQVVTNGALHTERSAHLDSSPPTPPLTPPPHPLPRNNLAPTPPLSHTRRAPQRPRWPHPYPPARARSTRGRRRASAVRARASQVQWRPGAPPPPPRRRRRVGWPGRAARATSNPVVRTRPLNGAPSGQASSPPRSTTRPPQLPLPPPPHYAHRGSSSEGGTPSIARGAHLQAAGHNPNELGESGRGTANGQGKRGEGGGETDKRPRQAAALPLAAALPRRRAASARPDAPPGITLCVWS